MVAAEETREAVPFVIDLAVADGVFVTVDGFGEAAGFAAVPLAAGLAGVRVVVVGFGLASPFVAAAGSIEEE